MCQQASLQESYQSSLTAVRKKWNWLMRNEWLKRKYALGCTFESKPEHDQGT